MTIRVVCSHCSFYDKDPNIEINFREGIVYYMCPECKKESQIKIRDDKQPLPRIRVR